MKRQISAAFKKARHDMRARMIECHDCNDYATELHHIIAVEDGGTKIDIDAGWRTTDKEYLDKVKQHFIPKVAEFKPALIFHLLGHDTAAGDYGDRGLSKEFFPELVRLVKDTADTLCQGRYVVGIGGGHRADIAEYIALKSVPILAEIET